MPGDILKLYFPWRYHLGFKSTIPDRENTQVKNRDIKDVTCIYYPHDQLFGKMIKQGKLALWNPYNFCGHPLMAEGRTSEIYPLKILIYLFFPTGISYTIMLIINHILMGTGMFLFLKGLNISNLPALYGALIWMYNGYITINLEYSTHIQVGVFIAFNLLFVDRLIKHPEHKINLLLLALSLGLTFLSGHLQYVFYVNIITIIYFLFRLTTSAENKTKIFILFILAYILAFMIGMGQTIPSLQLVLLSERPEFNFSQMQLLIPLNIADLIFPCAMGDIMGNFYFSPEESGVHNSMETKIFIGILALHFLILALFMSGWKKEKIFFLCLILLPFLINLKIPPFNLILSIPVLSGLTPLRYLYLFSFGASVMIALGAEGLINIKHKNIKKFLIITLICFFVVLITLQESFLYVNKNIESIMCNYMKIHTIHKLEIKFIINKILENYSIANPFFFIPLISWFLGLILLSIFNKHRKKYIIIIIILLSIGELWNYGLNTQTTCKEENLYFKTEFTNFLINKNTCFRISSLYDSATLPYPNTLMPYNIMDTAGYASIYQGRYYKFIKSIGSQNLFYIRPVIDNPEYLTKSIEKIMAIKYYFKLKEQEFPLKKNLNKDYRTVFSREKMELIENLQVKEIFFTAGSYKVIKSDNEILKYILDKKFNPYKEVILEEGIPDMKENPCQIERCDITNIKKYSPGEIEIEIIPENDKPFLLFISDNYYPGWKAKINGKETRIYRANYLFKAIPIISSANKPIKISLTFFPDIYKASLVISLISIIGTFIGITIFLIKNKP